MGFVDFVSCVFEEPAVDLTKRIVIISKKQPSVGFAHVAVRSAPAVGSVARAGWR